MDLSCTMTAHFAGMAAYSRWANERLYGDAATLPADALHRDAGVYFASLFATLAHLLQSDRAWMHLLRGGTLAAMALPPAPGDLPALAAARRAQDDAFVDWINTVDAAWLARPFHFVSGLGSLKGMRYEGTHATALTHVLNHQTHHRGQAHAALTRLGLAEPQPLDMLVMGFTGN